MTTIQAVILVAFVLPLALVMWIVAGSLVIMVWRNRRLLFRFFFGEHNDERN